MEPKNISSLVKPLLKLHSLEFSISPWGCTGLLKVLPPSTPLGIERTPPKSLCSWRPVETCRRREHTRPLLVPSKTSATYPQCYPVGFEYSSFQINCRKTRLAKTFRRTTWQKVHVINVQISESHPKVAESEPPKVEVQESAFCKAHQTLSTTALGRGIHSPHTHTGRDEVGKETGEERKGVCSNGRKSSLLQKAF